ncbi:type III-B CRISPR module RAMP protein Cmr4 [Thermus thermophilus]|uniref:type III-B CRISPR module RAMP protein Cmr4 n=1 Tax=Thermus thermophilus TaxID=274 RepID=UPI00194E1068|nr:type III-B CRISPR module RAMP protein Cmr4 [Thermus thermophilus]BCP98014.1 type III-B CRISPR module RAMP protein Cmr4 [Thermus thermophilus]BCQ00344.1 type III-B CRISPR module RAMP protein Cmr4 [Thermus thermophilus]
MAGYQKFLQVGVALDPIHVGAGGAQIGRVDLTIVRDPVTQVPKIPGSSLAGVYRTYVAMAYEEDRQASQSGQQSQGRQKPFYPDCAGLGLDQNRGHCRQPDCPVCTVFGFARGAGQEGGFAGLAAFTDAHVLLFPVPTRKGPMWVTAPMALKAIGLTVNGVNDNAVYVPGKDPDSPLNLGWLLLETRGDNQIDGYDKEKLKSLKIPDSIQNRLALVPDHLFAHIVNSNLEVRTSVSINPETGAAEEGALFSYEALPRGTVLVWEIIAKNPAYFQISGQRIAISNPEGVHDVTKKAHPYLEHLGIGGMGTRGMGRVKVVYSGSDSGPGAQQSQAQSVNPTSPANQGGGQP